MTTTIHDVFGVRTLLEVVPQVFGSVKGDHYFQDLFMNEGTSQTLVEYDGKELMAWDEVKMSKTAAGFTTRDGGYKEDKKTDKTHRMIALATIKLKKKFKSSQVYANRGDGTLRDNVPQLIRKEVLDMLNKIRRSKEIMASMILKGGGTIDSSVIEGMDISITITFSNLGNFVPSASWALPGTKLLSDDFDRVRAAFYANSGEEAKRMIVDAKIRNYMAGNTELQGYLQSGSALAALQLGDKPSSGAVLDDFALDGMSWHATRTGYKATEASSTITKYLGDDKIIALPEDLSTVLGYCEAKGDVPVNAFGQDASALLTKSPTEGISIYAMPGTSRDDDPACATVFCSWRGMFTLLNPYEVLYDGVLA